MIRIGLAMIYVISSFSRRKKKQKRRRQQNSLLAAEFPDWASPRL
jgi:hypothetical protein